MGARRPQRTNHRKQADWMRSVKVGDVLRSGRGTLRVVREASFFHDGQLRAIAFVIRHKSWTGRATTTMNYTDLMQFGYAPHFPRVRSKLATELDAKIAHCVKHHRMEDQVLFADDVRGIP